MEDEGKTVYLHVGAPTAGTAFLHQALWLNRRRLGHAGVCYPLTGPMQHFGAVMDLREMSWGGHRDPAWEGTWDRVAQRVRDWNGHTAVFSHGLLGGADEQQVRRAVKSLEPAEVHVVFVTRDLGWQLICDWQEQIRHNHTVTFERFVDDLVTLGIDAPKPYGEMFWGLHDPVRVLKTWESAVPSHRIHVVSLPPPGAGTGTLWSRFCTVAGIDPTVCDVGGIEDEESMSAIEAEVLRRLNGRLGTALGGDYERVVRAHLLGNGLTAGTDAIGRVPMGLPPRHLAWAAERTRLLAEALRAAGYEVVGDLGELTTSGPPDEGTMLPGEVPDDQIAAVSLGVTAYLLERLNAVRDQIGLAHLHGQLGDVRENLDRLLDAAASPQTGLQRAARRAAGRRNP
ncbi:hypothetical protein [Actinomadura sp. 6K520]|jgi:hypothetical protein|uniref:hypothetical protein n=1 Tax=Actinomadura sp. 6K520 TaxID=2530364 RepID=UPI00105094CE|nr:hypothetical protein [Actinomadura sp. 6K520]TDE22084.1 hypothetical protein E1289_30210 [Actinomadura sp. 6K520]